MEAKIIIITVLRMSIEDFEAKIVGKITRKDTKIVSLEVHHIEDLPGAECAGQYVPPKSKFEVVLSWAAAIPGHSLIAHLDLNNGLVTSFGGTMTEQEYKHMTAGQCDLCHTQRDRRHQFLVEHTDSGRRLVVGGSCARKFCGCNLESLAKSLEHIKEVCGNLERDDWGGESRSNFVGHKEVFAAIELALKDVGWISSREADGWTKHSTSSVAVNYLSALYSKGSWSDDQRQARNAMYETMETVDVDRYRQHAKDKLAAKWSDFWQSVVNALQGDCCDWKAVGRLAYAAFDAKVTEARPKVDRRAYNGSNKMHDLPGTWNVVSIKEGESMYGYYLGVTAMNEAGETIWFKSTKGTSSVEIGGAYQLRGKVKSTKDTITFMSNMKTR